MKDASLIYKTSSPVALAWFADGQERSTAAQKLRAEYIKKVTKLYGPYVDYSDGTERSLMVSRRDVVGLAAQSDEKVPDGWRLDKHGCWVPRLSTAEGKKNAKELAELRDWDYVSTLNTVGVPSMILAANYLLHPGFKLDTETGELYQYWSDRSEHVVAQIEKQAATVADVVWTRVPLSEWYAREERLAVNQ